MERPGRCGDWLAPPPSPPRAHAPGRHDERGVGTSTWPPAGTYTWPSARTFPWPRTRRDVRLRVEREPNGPALLVSGVLLDGLVTAADEAFSVQNDTTEDGVVQPAGPQRSGSPESLVPWQSLGRPGRTFAATGSAAPTTAARGRRCRCCRTCCSPGSDTVTLDLDVTPRSCRCCPSLTTIGSDGCWTHHLIRVTAEAPAARPYYEGSAWWVTGRGRAWVGSPRADDADAG